MTKEAYKRLHDFSLDKNQWLSKTLSEHKDFVDASPSISSAIASHFAMEFLALSVKEKRRALSYILSMNDCKVTWQTIFYTDILVLTTKDDDNYNIPKDQWEIPQEFQNYCGNERLDTDVESCFIDILRSTCNEAEVRIILALCWTNNVIFLGLDFTFRHLVYIDGVKEIHISVLENDHFFSIHALVEDRQVYIMDSLADMLNDAHKFHVLLLLHHLDYCHKINKADWKVFFVLDNPKQDNGYDCGVYMLKALECWVNKVRLPFSKDNVQNARYFLLSQVASKNISGLKRGV